MLNYSLMKPEGILLLEPHGPLTEQDFDGVSQDVDDFLAEHPKLHGVMIQSKDFPGWENWAGFSAHMGFVRDHRHQVEQIAQVVQQTSSTAEETSAAAEELNVTTENIHQQISRYRIQ